MWIDINGWEGLYEVNECGEVKNKLNGNLLAGDRNSGGYCRVCLYNIHHVPRKQRFFRHRLVAQHFIPNPNKLPEVNHKDLNKEHNFVGNLEWCSKKENELHSRIYGTKEYKPFKVLFKNGNNMICDAASELSDKIGVSIGTIRHWLHKRCRGYEKYGIANIEYV